MQSEQISRSLEFQRGPVREKTRVATLLWRTTLDAIVLNQWMPTKNCGWDPVQCWMGLKESSQSFTRNG